MSTTEQEVVEQAPPAPAPAPAPVEVPEKPAGYHPVDFSVVPEEHRKEFENRFGHLYGQIKQNQRERATERKFYQNLEAKLDKFISEDQEHKAVSRIELMGEKAKQQFAEGKHDDAIKTIRKIAQAERDFVPKPAPEPAVEAASEFSEDETNHLMQFVDKNPWAAPGAPTHDAARTTIARFLEQGLDLVEAVDATERIMAPLVVEKGKPKESVVAQTVLGQSHSSQTDVKKVVLDEHQQRVAKRFFPSLKPEDAYARYAKNLD